MSGSREDDRKRQIVARLVDETTVYPDQPVVRRSLLRQPLSVLEKLADIFLDDDDAPAANSEGWASPIARERVKELRALDSSLD